jgi:tetratricopeptide (TPR) repeat protein
MNWGKLLIAGIIIGSLSVLSGCASLGKGSEKTVDYNRLYELQMEKQFASLPQDPGAHKKPSEMTAKDYEMIGDILMERGQLHSAFIKYDKALQRDPQNIGLHYKKGVTLLRGGLHQDSITEFEKVLKIDPGHAPANLGMGQAYFKLNDFEQSEKFLLKAVELKDNLWEACNLLGMIYDYRKQFKSAIDQYTQAIFINPKEGILYNNLGVSYMMAGDNQRAIKAFKAALKANYRKEKLYNNLGLALSKSGNYQEAFETFRKAGNLPAAYNNLGCVFLNQGDYLKAVKCFEKAIELDPAFYARASENLNRARMELSQAQ